MTSKVVNVVLFSMVLFSIGGYARAASRGLGGADPNVDPCTDAGKAEDPCDDIEKPADPPDDAGKNVGGASAGGNTKASTRGLGVEDPCADDGKVAVENDTKAISRSLGATDPYINDNEKDTSTKTDPCADDGKVAVEKVYPCTDGEKDDVTKADPRADDEEDTTGIASICADDAADKTDPCADDGKAAKASIRGLGVPDPCADDGKAEAEAGKTDPDGKIETIKVDPCGDVVPKLQQQVWEQ